MGREDCRARVAVYLVWAGVPYLWRATIEYIPSETSYEFGAVWSAGG